METKNQMFAGFGREDITPEEPIALAGFFNSERRVSQNILDRLYTTCVAVSDPDGVTVLQYQLDNMEVCSQYAGEITKYFDKKYGIGRDYIHITATHTHSAPDTDPDTKEPLPPTERYIAMVIRKLIAAGEAALTDRSPALMEYGTTHTRNLNFTKNYYFTNGLSLGDNHRKIQEGELAGHASQVDDVLLVLRFRRVGKPDIAMVNWRAHNQFTGGAIKTDISSDYVQAFREAAEERFSCLFAFFQGYCGNVNPYSRIPSEERTRDYQLYGRYLTEHMAEIYDRLTPVASGPIRAMQYTMKGRIDHTQDDLLDKASAIADEFVKNDDRAAAIAAGKPYGIFGAYHALAIVRRAALPPTQDFSFFAWSIGDIGFVASEFEAFDSLGVYIREQSPFAMTFTLGYTDSVNSYMPTALAYEFGSYEVDTTDYAPGTSERMTVKMVQMLLRLKNGFDGMEDVF